MSINNVSSNSSKGIYIALGVTAVVGAGCLIAALAVFRGNPFSAFGSFGTLSTAHKVVLVGTTVGLGLSVIAAGSIGCERLLSRKPYELTSTENKLLKDTKDIEYKNNQIKMQIRAFQELVENDKELKEQFKESLREAKKSNKLLPPPPTLSNSAFKSQIIKAWDDAVKEQLQLEFILSRIKDFLIQCPQFTQLLDQKLSDGVSPDVVGMSADRFIEQFSQP